MALTQAESNIIGADRGADATRYSLPYFLLFEKEMSDLVSGVWLEDTERFGAGLIRTADGKGDIRLPAKIRSDKYVRGFQYPVATAPAPVSGDPMVNEPVDPNPTWSTRFFAQLMGMQYFTEIYNQDFADQNKVFRLGDGETLTPGPNHELVTFEDPFGGGYAYAATQVIGTTHPPAGAWMIRRAQELKSDWDFKVQQSQDPLLTPEERAQFAELAVEYEGKTREAVRNLEMMRGMYGVFGDALWDW